MHPVAKGNIDIHEIYGMTCQGHLLTFEVIKGAFIGRRRLKELGVYLAIRLLTSSGVGVCVTFVFLKNTV